MSKMKKWLNNWFKESVEFYLLYAKQRTNRREYENISSSFEKIT